MHRVVIAPLGATALTLAALAVAAPAHALTVGQSPAGLTVRLTPAEAAALVAGNAGPFLGQLPPTFTQEAKDSLGQTITRLARQTAADETATMVVIIDGPLHGPRSVTIGVQNP